MNSLKLQPKKFVRKESLGKRSSFKRSTDNSVQREIKEKERAIETLSKRYGQRPKMGEKLPPTVMGEEEVRQVLYAVGDNHGTTLKIASLTQPTCD